MMTDTLRKQLVEIPVLPEGWHIDTINLYVTQANGREYVARLFGPGVFDEAEGEGGTWLEALHDANVRAWELTQ